MRRFSITVPTVAFEVSTIGETPVTVAISEIVPSSSWKSTRAVCCTCSSRSRVPILNPSSSVFTVYGPGGSAGNSNRPTALVTVVSAAAPTIVEPSAQIPAAARNYWAFKLPVQAAVPNAGNFTNPIDKFLEKARQERGLKAAPRASRQTLVRRAYLDLIGLPPTPEQAAAFLADTSPDAWERLIESLLASPHYGERWGRHWLDVARYADSSGFEHDYDRPNAWRYRDYVIRAFNDDKPYDLFLKEQIAGDELDAKSDETFIATGFLRAGPRVAFREKDNPERRYEYLDDLIATTGRGVLGLTIQCARCHNHKFDPIPQRDYYSLVTTFFGYVETTYPLAARAEAEAYEKKLKDVEARQAPLKAEIKKIEAPYVEKARQDAYKQFPEHVQRVIAKPEAERTVGEQLLAQQVIEQVNVGGRTIDRYLTPDEAARKKV